MSSSPKVPDSFRGSFLFDEEMELRSVEVALHSLHVQTLLEQCGGMRPPGPLPSPLVAQLEFTQRCNLACEFCYNDSGPSNPDELSPEALRSLCRQLRQFDLVELIVSGGEPLARRAHMDVIFREFEGSGVPVHLLTNGTLLDAQTLDWLARNQVVTIQVSLDGGDPMVHDAERGQVGSWERAYRGVCRAHDHGFHTIVSTTVTRKNCSTLERLIDLAYWAGVDVVNVGDLITWGRAADWMALGACGDAEFDDVADVVKVKRAEYDGLMSLRLAVNMLFYVCKIKMVGQQSLLVRGNGDVIPHCTLSGLVLGNVHEEPLETIWSRLSRVAEDPRLDQVLLAHQIRTTPRHHQLRSFTRGKLPVLAEGGSCE